MSTPNDCCSFSASGCIIVCTISGLVYLKEPRGLKFISSSTRRKYYKKIFFNRWVWCIAIFIQGKSLLTNNLKVFFNMRISMIISKEDHVSRWKDQDRRFRINKRHKSRQWHTSRILYIHKPWNNASWRGWGSIS